MKAQRVIQQRSPSARATCRRIVGPDRCGAELKLIITPSPLAGWEWLVVQRCAEHANEIRGVLDAAHDPEPA